MVQYILFSVKNKEVVALCNDDLLDILQVVAALKPNDYIVLTGDSFGLVPSLWDAIMNSPDFTEATVDLILQSDALQHASQVMLKLQGVTEQLGKDLRSARPNQDSSYVLQRREKAVAKTNDLMDVLESMKSFSLVSEKVSLLKQEKRKVKEQEGTING